MSIRPYFPEICLTGFSNEATVRRCRPKTAKNSFQKVYFSALSLLAPAQSEAKRMAFWRISFHEMGILQFPVDLACHDVALPGSGAEGD
jgi:hypothetical protein